MVILTFVCVGYVNSKPLFSKYSENFIVYVGSNSSNAEILTVDSKDYMSLKKVTGESVKISSSNFDVYDFFEKYNAEIVFTETVDGVVSYYGYSKDIKYQTIIGGKRINLHVAKAKNLVTVGSPIIYGSF
jgi:hypothetical protein